MEPDAHVFVGVIRTLATGCDIPGTEPASAAGDSASFSKTKVALPGNFVRTPLSDREAVSELIYGVFPHARCGIYAQIVVDRSIPTYMMTLRSA